MAMDVDDPGSDFELLFTHLTRRPRGSRFEPNADVIVDEVSARMIVRVELAGADAESLRVAVDERHLVIVGRRVEQTRTRSGTFLQKEIEYGEFMKKIRLPAAIQYDDVTATYGDGMLTIVLPIAQMAYIPETRTEIRMIVKRTLA